MKTAIVIGGSKGIGKSISKKLIGIDYNVISTSTKTLDTSDLRSVNLFLKNNKKCDCLVLNTGGPPLINFDDIKIEDFEKYHRQLFLSFCLFLQNIKINKNGHIFLISSSIIKEPVQNMDLSSAYRLAFSSVFKNFSKRVAKKNIVCINIAPAAIKTRRIEKLVSDIRKYEESLPSKKMGNPNEIGDLIATIIVKKIKYLNGSTIFFDGNISNQIF